MVVAGVCVRARARGEEARAKKPKNRAAGARFRVRRVKRRWRGVAGGGLVVWKRWWWRRGCAFKRARGGRRLGPKNPKTEPLWLGFGRAATNGSGGRRGEVGRHHGQGSGGTGGAHPSAREGEGARVKTMLTWDLHPILRPSPPTLLHPSPSAPMLLPRTHG
jgi:hypothetical protein